MLDSIMPLIDTDKMSSVMMSFMGYLQYSYTAPYKRAIAALEQLGNSSNKAYYALAYMLDRYPEHY